MPTATITEEDVTGFRDKLEDWGAALSPGERAVLHMVLVRAFPPATGTDDVEGFAMVRDPASGLPTGKRMHKPYTVTANIGDGLPTFIGLPISFDQA